MEANRGRIRLALVVSTPPTSQPGLVVGASGRAFEIALEVSVTAATSAAATTAACVRVFKLRLATRL